MDEEYNSEFPPFDETYDETAEIEDNITSDISSNGTSSPKTSSGYSSRYGNSDFHVNRSIDYAAQAANNRMYEDALLGFILTDPEMMLSVSEILPKPEYFSDPTNRAAYSIFLRLYATDHFPGDAGLMVKELYSGGEKNHFPTIDDAMRYVNRLMDNPASKQFNPRNYQDYAEQIRWEHDKRAIKNLANVMNAEADSVSSLDKEDFISRIESSFGDITMSIHGKEGLSHISEMSSEFEEELALLHGGKPLAGGVMTGMDSLDQKLNGLKGGEVIVLAGRPGMGKTALSMQIATNIASQRPAPLEDGSPGPQNAVLIFSLEMMEEQLMSRMVATAGRVNMQMFMSEYQHFNDDHYYAKSYGQQFEDKMKTKLETQYERAQAALRYVKELPVYSTTESGLSPNAIKSMVMQKQREIEKKGQKLALIVIDYLQLMTPTLTKANASRTEEVGDMSRKTKLLAKEFDVPVLLLAQLNRDAETNEAPNLKHLRESGSIEQDADKVMFIWSEHAEMTTNEFQELPEHSREEALRREQMKVKINVAKNRQGNSGNVDVIFDKGFQTFVSQSSQNYSAGETFDEFCAKYYHKTRSGEDLFWPRRPGDLPEELEEFRTPEIQEQPWLQSDGNVVTMTSRSDKKKTMTVQSASVYGAPTSPNVQGPAHADAPMNAFTNAADAVSAAADAAIAGQSGKVELDRSMPKELPEIDDVAVDFGEEAVDDAEVETTDNEVDLSEYATLEDALAGLTGIDEDDEEIDLSDLEALERASEELE